MPAERSLAGLLLFLAACRSSPAPAPAAALGDGGACPAVELLHYRLRVVLEPAERRLRARAELELSCLPPDRLGLALHPRLHVEEAWVEGRRVEAERPPSPSGIEPAAAPLQLAYRGRSGRAVLVELHYAGRLRDLGTPLGELSADSIELAAPAGWYPRLVGPQRFTAELVAQAPARYRLVAPGRGQPPLTVAGPGAAVLREWRWTTERPREQLLLFGAPHLRSLELIDRRQRQISHYSTLPAQLVETITATLARARSQLEETLGPVDSLQTGTLVFVARGGPGYRSEEVDVVSEETARTSTTVADELVRGLTRAWRDARLAAGARPPSSRSSTQEEHERPKGDEHQPEQ